MKKILKFSGVTIILLLLFLVPMFGIYAATFGSLPGEWNYPLKQRSEMMVDQLVQISPSASAYFSLLKSQRRYQEVLGLIENEKDASSSVSSFLEQAKKTLFDIQSVPDVDTRISYFSQHQTFLANARQNLLYKSDSLKELLGIDRSTSVKTFTIDTFEGEQGKLVAKRQNLTAKGINEKDPVPDSLFLANIKALDDAVSQIDSLLQK